MKVMEVDEVEVDEVDRGLPSFLAYPHRSGQAVVSHGMVSDPKTGGRGPGWHERSATVVLHSTTKFD